MLPFLQPKKIVAGISSRRGKSPDIEVKTEMEAPGQKMDGDLKRVAEDMLRAFEHKSILDLAKALKEAHDICDESPHEEGPHINEDVEPGE